jgi:hypothetical protein
MALEAFAINCVRQLRQSEVQNLGFAPIGDEDICWLDVTMDNAFFMRCTRRMADKYELSIESRALKGGPATTAISFPFSMEDWTWSPDGPIIASVPDPANSRSNTCNF